MDDLTISQYEGKSADTIVVDIKECNEYKYWEPDLAFDDTLVIKMKNYTKQESCLLHSLMSTMISSNKSFSEWGELFTDQVLATALLDRLLHHSSMINIRGQSYRLKEKRQAGLFQGSDAIKEPVAS